MTGDDQGVPFRCGDNLRIPILDCRNDLCRGWATLDGLGGPSRCAEVEIINGAPPLGGRRLPQFPSWQSCPMRIKDRKRLWLNDSVPDDDVPIPTDSDCGGLDVVGSSLSHSYEGPTGEVSVLRDVDFRIPKGGYAALVGPSGAGKTTLLALIGGLEHVQSGSLLVGGQEVAALSGDPLAAYRRTSVGFIFQNFGLLEALTALENVELAAVLAGERHSIRRQRSSDLLASVGMTHRAAHQPGALSGGERQRVAIARALVNRPRLVLADEPTGNLDDDTSEEVMALLESIQLDRGCTLLVVTHDRAIAGRASLRLVLDRGHIVTTETSMSRVSPT